MKLSVKQIVEAASALRSARANTLDDAVRLRIVKIRAALKGEAEAYQSFDEDLVKTMKGEGFDDLAARAQAKTLSGEELARWNAEAMRYGSAVGSARAEYLAREVEVADFPKLGEEDVLKLLKENDWPWSFYDALEVIIR